MFLALVELPHDGRRVVLMDTEFRHGTGRTQADIRGVLFAEQFVERLDSFPVMRGWSTTIEMMVPSMTREPLRKQREWFRPYKQGTSCAKRVAGTTRNHSLSTT